MILIKRDKLDLFKLDISKNTFQRSVGVDYLLDVSKTYKNILSISFDNNMTHLTKGMNFYSIFSKELNRIKATSTFTNDTKEIYINNTSIKNLNYSNFKIENNTRFIFEISKDEEFLKGIHKDKNEDNSLLFPVLYTFIPNLIDDAKFNNLTLEKVFFIDIEDLLSPAN